MNPLTNHQKLIVALLLIAPVILLFFVGCSATSSGFLHEPEYPEKVMNYIQQSDLLAYIEKNNDTIFVAEGYESLISQKLEAKIESDIWLLKDENFAVKRPLRLLDPRKWHPNVYIEVEWTYLNNHDCIKRKKGEFVNFYNNDGKFVRSYRITKDSYWCIKNNKNDGLEHACKTRYQAIRGEFWTGKKGTGRKKIEDRHLAICRD